MDLEKHEKNMMHIIITSDPSVDLFSHEIKKALGSVASQGALWTKLKNGLMTKMITHLTCYFNFIKLHHRIIATNRY